MKQQLEDLAFAALHPKRYAEIDHMVVDPHARARRCTSTQVLEQVRERLAELRIDGRGHRPPEAPLEHLREDGRQGQGVRRDLRPRRHPGHRRHGEGLLRRARLDPRHVEAGAGPVQGLHRDAEVQPLPVVAHDGGRARRASRSRCRSARGRCTSGPSSASPRTGATRTNDAGVRHGVAEPHRRLAAGDAATPTQFMENLKIDLEQDEVFVFTPKGKVDHAAARARRRSTSPTPIHTEVGHACIGARVNGRLVPLDSELHVGRHRRDLHLEGRGRRPVARLAEDRRHAAGRATRSASGSRVSGARTRSRPAARSSSRRCAARACRCRSSSAATSLDEVGRRRMNYADLDALYAAIGENHVSAKSVAPARRDASCARATPSARSSCRSPCARRAGRKRTDSAGVHVEGLDDVMVRLSRCCTPVPGDEIIGLRHPRPRRVGAPRRLRQRGVAVDRPGRPAHRRRVGRASAGTSSSPRSR